MTDNSLKSSPECLLECLKVKITDHIDKSVIADSFGASASSYDSGAALQRSVGNQLLSFTQPCHQGVLVDLGTGPGYFSTALNDRCGQYIGVDIAPKMLEFAKTRNRNNDMWWLTADAESLPLATASIDGIFSSLMLQWVHRLPSALAQAMRVLKSGGQFALSTLVDGTLLELQRAWSQVDDYQHVNSFLSLIELQTIVADSGFKLVHFENKPHTVWYDDVIDLMRDLKAIGANQTAQSGRGLMGKTQLKTLRNGYEIYRRQGRLPATYQVVYVVLEKI